MQGTTAKKRRGDPGAMLWLWCALLYLIATVPPAHAGDPAVDASRAPFDHVAVPGGYQVTQPSVDPTLPTGRDTTGARAIS